MLPELLASVHTPVRELATPAPAHLYEMETVFEALARIRTKARRDRIVHFYVTDSEDCLVGVAPVRRLLLADPATLVGEVMVHPVYSVEASDPLGKALRLLAAQRLLALPVVDSGGQLTGVLDVSGTTRMLAAMERQESDRKLFQTLGIRSGRCGGAILPALAAGLALALIAASFEGLLIRVPAVAFFIPVMLAAATAGATRAVSGTLESLHWAKITRERLRDRMSSLTTGIPLAAFAGMVAGLWLRSLPLALTITCSLTVAFIAGAGLGFTIPLLLHRWRLDPKFAAGPIATAIANAVALLFYLAIAALII